MKNEGPRFPFPIDFKFLLSRTFLIVFSIAMLILSISVSLNLKNEKTEQLKAKNEAVALGLVRDIETGYRQIYSAIYQLTTLQHQESIKKWESELIGSEKIYNAIESISLLEDNSNSIAMYQNPTRSQAVDNLGIPFFEENFLIQSDDKLQYIIQVRTNVEELVKPFLLNLENKMNIQLIDNDKVIYTSSNDTETSDGIMFEQALSLHDRKSLVLICSPTKEMQNNILYSYLGTQFLSLFLSFLTCLTVFFAQRFYQYYKLNETRFRTLLDEVNLPSVIMDLKGCVTYCNDSFLSKTGWKREELLGKGFFQNFMPPNEISDKFNIFESMIKGEKPPSEWPLLTKSGELLWFLIDTTILRDTKGIVVGIAGIGEDITERKLNEKMINTQFEFNKTLFAIDQIITSRKSMDETLSFILNQVLNNLKVDAAAIFTFDPHSQCLEHKASKGFRTPLIKQACIPLGIGIAGKAALEKKEMWNCDLKGTIIDPAHMKIITEEQFFCYRVIPLLVNDKINGILEVFCLKQTEYDETKSGFLRALAQQTAIAIDNLTLFNNLQKSNTELFQAYESTIEGWSHALDLRDKETEDHSLRVTEMTLKICRAAGMAPSSLIQVRRGALLHDIGKMGIPDSILLKVEKLTDEEWLIIKKHPVQAFELLSPIEYLRPALDIPYCHHEKWDGSGYPRGLKEEQIPFAARIFAVVDVWDALMSDRPYRKGWPEEKVYAFLKSLSGTHFDPRAVKMFFEVLDQK
jgi:PAS domain S-box-containing protein/putative nucleotidyltransferase with HDIG domain